MIFTWRPGLMTFVNTDGKIVDAIGYDIKINARLIPTWVKVMTGVVVHQVCSGEHPNVDLL